MSHKVTPTKEARVIAVLVERLGGQVFVSHDDIRSAPPLTSDRRLYRWERGDGYTLTAAPERLFDS